MKRKIILWFRNVSDRRWLTIEITLALATFLLGISHTFPYRNLIFISTSLIWTAFNVVSMWVREFYGSRTMDELEFECSSTIEYFRNELNKIYHPSKAIHHKVH